MPLDRMLPYGQRGQSLRVNFDLFPHGATAKPISQWPFSIGPDIRCFGSESDAQNRVGERNPMGCLVRPSVARSASTSPITGANLKP